MLDCCYLNMSRTAYAGKRAAGRVFYSGVLLTLLGVLFVFGGNSRVLAQTTQWNGSVSSDWYDQGNWSNGVPDANSEVYITWYPGDDPVLENSITIRRLIIGSNDKTTTISRDATLTIEEDLAIGHTGELDVADGSVIVNQASSIGGRISVNDGTITFLDDFTLTSSAVFTVQTGVVNFGDPGPPVISANFVQTSGTTFHLNQGTLNIYGQSEYTGGGAFHAGSGNINLDGDIKFNGGSDIHFDTSTVNISGSVEITSNTNQDAHFYDLNIQDGSEVDSRVNVFVENDMVVHENASYVQSDNTWLNVVGIVTGDSNIDSPRPYMVNIIIDSPTSIIIIFNREMNPATTENPANYRVEHADGTEADDLSGSNPTQIDTNLVSLQLDFSIEPGVSYYLISNNLESVTGRAISNNHIKRILKSDSQIFYSRQNGLWNSTSSWSTISHTGPEASRVPGQLGDHVRIDQNHTISIESAVSLASISTVMVNNTGALEVADGGTLNAGSQSVTGTGSFHLLAGGTLMMGSPDGISESGPSGNIQTDSRTFSQNAAYIYNGNTLQETGSGLPVTVRYLTADNPEGVHVTSDLIVDETLFLTNGVTSILSGNSLIADNRDIDNGSLRYLRDISGSKGWRIMSSPVKTDFLNFVTGPDPNRRIITQGFTGADFPDQQPNIMHYAEDTPGSSGDTVTTNMNWRTLSGMNDPVVSTRGYLIYVFDGAEGPGSVPSRDDELPFTLSVSGDENLPANGGGSLDFGVSHTARHIYTDDTGWNLVGNPFGAALDWDAGASWTRNGMHETIYVWDPGYNDGDYRQWNGETGSLGSGKIAPFQGFWVKAEDSGAEMMVSPQARTIGGTGFRGKINGTSDDGPVTLSNANKTLYTSENSSGRGAVDFKELVVQLSHMDTGFESETRLMFTDDGGTGSDRYDAYRLVPLSENYLSLFTFQEDGSQLSINNLPGSPEEELSIPMEAFGIYSGKAVNGSATLQWKVPDSFPNDLSIRLHDRETGRIVNMRSEDTYDFNLNSNNALYRKAVDLEEIGIIKAGHGYSEQKGSRGSGMQSQGLEHPERPIISGKINVPGKPVVMHYKSSSVNSARFRILISGLSNAPEHGEVPVEVVLNQNYPNPFNPGTRIQFGLPDESRVRLTVYDMLGRQVSVLADGIYSRGTHEVNWDAGMYSSGTYIYRLETDEAVLTRKMMLVK